MEQDLKLYEFRMNDQSYSFEAPNQKVAEDYRRYAIMHFRELLGQDCSEREISGPYLVVPRTNANQ